VTAGLKPSMMYFSELSPPTIIDHGLDGPLVEKGTVLLKASDTDWLRWNGKPEYAKTGMVVRSEREAKLFGAVLVEVKSGSGRLLVCNLPAAPGLIKEQTLVRAILANLGVPLKDAEVIGDAFLKSGELISALGAGRYAVPDDGAGKSFVDPTHGDDFRVGAEAGEKKWGRISVDGDAFDLRQNPPLLGPGDDAVTYLSFWVLSPRALDDLLLEPNVPKVDFQVETPDAIEIWLNGKSILQSVGGPDNQAKAQGLPLQRGWNHFLIRAAHGKGDDRLKAKLMSSQPGFLGELKSALQKPEASAN
jgi:hypothetical protein